MKIHWWEFPRRRTCHRNVPGLMYDESYLGEVYDTDEGWTFKLRPEVEQNLCLGPEYPIFSSCEKASKALLVAVGGEPVTTWD